MLHAATLWELTGWRQPIRWRATENTATHASHVKFERQEACKILQIAFKTNAGRPNLTGRQFYYCPIICYGGEQLSTFL